MGAQNHLLIINPSVKCLSEVQTGLSSAEDREGPGLMLEARANV